MELPTSFGRQKPVFNVELEIERTRRFSDQSEKRSMAVGGNSTKQSDVSDSESESDTFPIDYQFQFHPHRKAISTMAINKSGSRFFTGSYDSLVKFWDFVGMGAEHRSFREVNPYAQKLRRICCSAAENILVIAGGSQAKVYDRDGADVYETRRGDMYLVDMNNTTGHVSDITDGCWSDIDPSVCFTSSSDGTIRFWDLNYSLGQKQLATYKGRKGKSKVKVTALAAHHKTICAAASDGSLALIPVQTSRITSMTMDVRTSESINNLIFMDENTIVSRGEDNSIKLWDVRQFVKPMLSRNDLISLHLETNMVVSPDSRFIATGTSSGHLHILNRSDLLSEKTIAVSSEAIISVLWNDNINQIFCGLINGDVDILYSPQISQRGAITVLSAPRKRRLIDDDSSLTTDISGLAEVIGEDMDNPVIGFSSKLKNLDRKDPIKSKKPSLPVNTLRGPDMGRFKQNQLQSSHNEDPRAELLKYAELAEKDPLFTAAYKETQPNAIFDFTEEHFEEDKELEEKRRKLYRIEGFKR